MPSLIVATLYILTALLPLLFSSVSSELFEFPKFLLLWSGAIVIAISWVFTAYTTGDWHLYPKDHPRHLKLIHYAMLGVLITQAVATIFSIHPYTSFWGYYSRFHQGLLTTICYTIIYFAAVKWLDKKSTLKLINISIKAAILVSLIAILEHYNISITCIIMSVFAKLQNAVNPVIVSTKCWGTLTNPLDRSFATLGQPNWLAAYLIPNIFLLFYVKQKQFTNHFLSQLLTAIYLFLLLAAIFLSNSRSGFISLCISILSYFIFLARSIRTKIVITNALILIVSFLITAAIFGTPYSPKLFAGIPQPATVAPETDTVLNSVSTASADIRKIVWTGALELVKKYPVFGTGPETFAYTYYWVRPLTHNYTTEWDYLYNKAHNEYLNLAATTGIVGLAAYLYWHFVVAKLVLFKIPDSKKINKEADNNLKLLFPVVVASVISFGITNFFGFSVVPVYFMMIIISFLPSTINSEYLAIPKLNLPTQLLAVFIIIILIIFYPAKFFLADYYFTAGKTKLDKKLPVEAAPLMARAVSCRPSEALYHSYSAESYSALGNIDLALREVDLSRTLNPYHLNFYKSRTKVYLNFSVDNLDYYKQASEELVQARKLAPTDPKLAYNLGLVYSRLNQIVLAEREMNQAIEMKKDYQEPYYALTLIYEQTKEESKIPDLLLSAQSNLATYSALLSDKMTKYLAQ